MVEFIKDAQFKFSHARNSNIWPWPFKQKSKLVDLADMDMSVSESDEKLKDCEDKDVFKWILYL